jgi:predicted porin
MKKSLIALAALATVATAAQAQSSVTVYGVMDVGIATINNVGGTDKRVTGLQNGGLSTSRLGFRGTEDLGGGLSANFNLEAEVLADTGSQTSTPEALFARASWVGLSSKDLGSVQLGRMNHFTYDQAIAGDAFGANNIGGFVAANNGFYARLENAVTVKSPVIKGIQLGAQTGTRTGYSLNGANVNQYGEVAGVYNGNRVNGVFASYNNGPLELGASWGNTKENTGIELSSITNAFARYNFGPVKLFTGWAEQKNDNEYRVNTSGTTGATTTTATTSALKVTTYFLGATAPLTSNINLMANAIQVKNELKSGAVQEPRVYALGATYSLSKRTTLYAIGAKSNQDNDSTQRIANSGKWSHSAAGTFTNGVAPAANLDQTGYTVGLRHTF